MNQKGFAVTLILIVVFLLVLTGGGAYYLMQKNTVIPSSQQSITQNVVNTIQPTPSIASSLSANQYNWVTISTSELNSWKSYNKYGFTLKYPSDWREDNSSNNDNDLITVLTPDNPCPPNSGCGGRESGVYIYLHDSKQKSTSKDYINQYLIPLAKLNNDPGIPKIVDNQPSYFNSIDAIVVNGFSGAGNPGPAAFIYKRMTNNWGNQVIELLSDSVDNDTVSKIFSSFKFSN